MNSRSIRWGLLIVLLLFAGSFFLLVKYECRDNYTEDDVPAVAAHEESQIRTSKADDGEASAETRPPASRQADISRPKDAAGETGSGNDLPDQEKHDEHEGKEYELTVASPERVFVNLSGGKSRSTTFGDEQLNWVLDRKISGRVLMKAGGDPIPGAFVLAGRYLDSMWGSMGANHGITTGIEGKFELAVRSDTDMLLIAMHRTIGWSPVTEIPAGRDNTSVELLIPEPGSLKGTVTRAGRPEYAVIHLNAERTRNFMMEVETNPDDGSYRFKILPPGTYKLTAAQKQKVHGGLSAKMPATVTVESGQTSTQNFELPVGLLLTVKTLFPEEREPKWISYTLLEGDLKIDSAKQLKEILQTPEGKRSKRVLVGGINLRDIMQFHDLTPGAYTLCVELEIEPKDILTFICGSVILKEEPSVQEYTVDLTTP